MLRSTAVFLVLAISHVLSQEVVDQNKPCGPHMFKGMDRCCVLPQLIPFESFETCFEKEDETKQDINTETKRKDKKSKTKGGRMCLIQCGMKKENMLDAEGFVNTTAVSEKLIGVAEAHWDPLVAGAVENCTAEYAKLDLSEIPVQEDKNGKICKPGPALFLSCINHRLSCECPSNAMGSIDPLCPERFTYLKKCSPFALIDGWKRRSRSSANSSKGQKMPQSGKKEKRTGKKNKKTSAKTAQN